jgi:hypothetical protein
MATLTNADILTLAIKQQLIGASLHVIENGLEVKKVIEDFEISMKTSRIYVQFSNVDSAWFFLEEKFKITSPAITGPIVKVKGSVNKIKT